MLVFGVGVGVGIDPIVGVGPALVIMSTLSLEYLLMFPYWISDTVFVFTCELHVEIEQLRRKQWLQQHSISYFFGNTLTIFGVPLTTAFVWQVWQLRSRLEVALFPWLCSQSQAAGAGSAQVGTTQTILFRINLDLQSKPAGAHDHNLGLDRMWPKMKIFFFYFFALQHI